MSQSRKRKSSSPQPSCSKRRDVSAIVPSSSNNFMKPGTLVKIVVRNFMCHDKLVVRLKNGMNFLMGRNGSGKSAILTAVVVGLGGKASVTNRGNSLKEFIKKGQNFCSVEITLNNVGADAYKPDVFGDEIIVLRSIASSGTSTYKIKSASGDVVTNKRDELEKIVVAFNIQVDNPVCVLNQDTARTFLNSSDPRDKFKMFVRATYLEYIQRSLDEALECVFRCRTILKKKTEAFKLTEKEMKELEDKWNRVQGLQTHQERCVVLELELPWAKCAEAEAEVQKTSEALEVTRQAIAKFDDEMEELNRQIVEIQAKKSSLHKKLDNYQDEHDMLEAQARRLRKQLQERKRELREKAQAVQVLDDRIAQYKQNATALFNQLRDLQARTEAEDKQERERVSRERARLTDQLDCLKAMEATRQLEVKMMEGALLKLRERHTEVQREKQDLSSNLARVQRKIESVQSSSRDTLSVFAAWMPDLVGQVEAAFKAKKFSKKPVGPLGAFIKTKDASWNAAIESYLKYGRLVSFCCDNTEDGRVLVQIMDRVVPRHSSKPTVIISAFLDRVHDVSAHKVRHPSHSSLLDMLTIEHPVVANCLIDNSEVERVLLVSTDREACTLMEQPDNVPPNCGRVITKRGYEYLHHPYRSYGPANKNLRARFLQVTMDQYERDLEREADDLRRKVAHGEHQLARVTAEMSSSKKQLDGTLRQLCSVSKQLQDAKAAIDQLTFEEPQAHSVEDLNREMVACKAEVAKLQQQREALMEEQEPIKIAVDQLKEQLDQTEQGGGTLHSTISIKAELEQLAEQQRRLESEQGHKNREGRDMGRRFESLQKQQGKLEAAARVALGQAEGSGPRVESPRSAQSVQQELDNCRRYVDGVAQELGDFEEIATSYHSYKSKYGEIRSTLKTLTAKLKDTEDRLKLREVVHARAKRSFSAIMNYCFMSLLNSADFKGSVKINYKEKTLALDVKPPCNKRSSVQRCTESLSGGERSYSTVSFIMALWQIVRPPFYFLDEFDVFMDKVNRGTVLKLLRGYADKNSSSQYVLLTPLDLASEDVARANVLEFGDPRQ